MSIRVLRNAASGVAAVLAVLYFSASAQAGLTICNRFDRAVSVAFAVAHHPPGEPSQQVANFFGWYGVAAGECRRIRDIYGDDKYREVTNGLVKVEDGMVKGSNEAMYLFVRDDLGHVWDGRTARLSSRRRDEAVVDRRDASGYVWPNTLSICSPTGHSPPDIASVDTMNADSQCDPGSRRVSYFLINPRYAVEYQLDVK